MKHICWPIKKANVIPFPILPLNKATILETVNILHCLIEYLGLTGVVKNKIILIKSDYLTIKNVIYAIY